MSNIAPWPHSLLGAMDEFSGVTDAIIRKRRPDLAGKSARQIKEILANEMEQARRLKAGKSPAGKRAKR